MYVKTFQRPRSFYGQFDRKPGDHLTTHYCPGCGHGNIHKMIAEAIDDLGAQDRTVFVSPVGCSVFAYYYFDVGNLQVAHGRAPAAATAVKRALPDSLVISYQGDGDLAAIGGNEILHAANRGEDFTVIFINNAIYGMTGGQMAPTTYLGMKTTTSPMGRVAANDGFPIRVSELLASLEGPTYIERVALYDNKTRAKARAAIRKALKNQIDGRGFSLVEVLSPCPTGWGVTPVDSLKWIQDHLLPIFPLGVLKDKSAEREHRTHRRQQIALEDLPGVLGVHSTNGSNGTKKSFDHTGNGKLPAKVVSPAAVQDQRLKIAGFGGQGLLFLGRLLAEAGMRENLHVSWLPSYGPEMRGGTANCHVNISMTEIGSPLVSTPNVLIAMNKPSLDKFESEVVSGGLVLYDSSLIDHPPTRSDVEVLALPATEMADKIGSGKSANMVALGALIGKTNLLEKDAVVEAMRAMTKRAELLDINIRAIEAGYEFARANVAEESLWGV
ncbi:MAG TPA: 2-oxoacid:acceptor oxidoreductase family protein [Pyrinomonadaceae bacterium]|nr:2-oxoacid:acceptor oxidoreductase family protein [Pyrinomonadaceae bacterium]